MAISTIWQRTLGGALACRLSRVLTCVILILAPSAVAQQGVKFETPTKVAPITDSDPGRFGSQVEKAIAMLNQLPNMDLKIEKTPPNGEYILTGTINGMEIPPTPLSSFKAGTSDWGQTYWEYVDGVLTVTILLKEQALKMPDLGPIVMLLYHEGYHAAFAKNFQQFAEECPDCEHQVVRANTATAMCNMANQCPPPEPPLSDSQRQSLADQANYQRTKCNEEDPDVCASCTVASKPPTPPCPPECSLEPCEE